MEFVEKKISSTEIYNGRIIHVVKDDVLLPNGKTSIREIIHHPGGVGILALDDQDCVPMVTQFRYAFGKMLLEIPAGKREPGEEAFITAQRELKEEVGATAESWEYLGEMIPSPGCYGEILHLYLARGLSFGDMNLDEDEFLNVERIPFATLVDMCMSGEISDAKTVIAVLKAKVMLGK